MPNKLSAATLMGDPQYMLAWLRSKRSRDIIAVDMVRLAECLGACFLRAHGYPNALWALKTGWPQGKPEYHIQCHPILADSLQQLYDDTLLASSGSVTAAHAIRVIEKITKEYNA